MTKDEEFELEKPSGTLRVHRGWWQKFGEIQKERDALQESLADSQRTADGLTAKVQRMEQSRLAVDLDRALTLLDRQARRLERVGGYSTPLEQSDEMDARALLAEHGKRAHSEIREMAGAHHTAVRDP